MHWRRRLRDAAIRTDRELGEMWRALRHRLFGSGEPRIVPYRGYGAAGRIRITARVVESRELVTSSEDAGTWDDLVAMYRRINAREVPGARIEARCGDHRATFEADEEGYVDDWLEVDGPYASDALWRTVDLRLVEPAADPGAGTTVPIMVPTRRARFAVVSDLDDTIVRTDATSLLKMARATFLGNARTRLPFPGAAAFYRALHDGDGAANPMLYVSRSPWNLYDLFEEFFELQGIPAGPVLFLRKWGLSEEGLRPARVRGHKWRLIRDMMETFAALRFVLVGDSGQKDPEIYSDLVHLYPDRILAVYIRNVSCDEERAEAIGRLAEEVAEAGSALVLAPDSVAMAEHAAERGWLDPSTLPSIAGERDEDTEPPGPLERLIGAEEERGGDVVVSEDRPDVGRAVEDAVEGTEAPPTVRLDDDERTREEGR